jgi:hydrogenase/urease accessory protein HupE
VAGDRVTPIARRGTIAALSALAASPVHAHLVETGFGAFYDGLAHVAVTPADLLVVVAIALLAGQCGRGAARLALFALPVAWLAGGLVGARWPEAAAWPLWTTLTFAVAGALVALNAKLRDAGVALLAVVAGLLHGLVNGATMAPGGATPLTLAGAITAIFCVTAILSAEVTALPAGWPRVAVRVAGSWIAAAGLLTLGWLLRPGG